MRTGKKQWYQVDRTRITCYGNINAEPEHNALCSVLYNNLGNLFEDRIRSSNARKKLWTNVFPGQYEAVLWMKK